MQFGSILCGFGKAKFREMSAETPVEEKEILFEVTSETFGILDNKAATFGEHLADAKGTTKPLRPCYHKASQQPDETWKFEKDWRVVINSGLVSLVLSEKTFQS